MRRTARTAGAVLTVAAAAAMLAAAAAVFWLHLAFQPVLSGSMRPAFAPGSVILTRSSPASQVKAGDVIVFRPPNHAAAYAHRVTSISGDPAHPVVTTKGDANPAADPWKAQLDGGPVPVVIWSVPAVGRVLVAAHSGGPRILLALFSGLVFLVIGTRSILGPVPSAPPTRLRPAHAAGAR
jgi:signal peptidase I